MNTDSVKQMQLAVESILPVGENKIDHLTNSIDRVARGLDVLQQINDSDDDFTSSPKSVQQSESTVDGAACKRKRTAPLKMASRKKVPMTMPSTSTAPMRSDGIPKPPTRSVSPYIPAPITPLPNLLTPIPSDTFSEDDDIILTQEGDRQAVNDIEDMMLDIFSEEEKKLQAWEAADDTYKEFLKTSAEDDEEIVRVEGEMQRLQKRLVALQSSRRDREARGERLGNGRKTAKRLAERAVKKAKAFRQLCKKYSNK